MATEQDKIIENAFKRFQASEERRDTLQNTLEGVLQENTRISWLRKRFHVPHKAKEIKHLKDELQRLATDVAQNKDDLDYRIGLRPGTYPVDSIDLIETPFALRIYYIHTIDGDDIKGEQYTATRVTGLVRVKVALRTGPEFSVTTGDLPLLFLPQGYPVKLFPDPNSTEFLKKELHPPSSITMFKSTYIAR